MIFFEFVIILSINQANITNSPTVSAGLLPGAISRRQLLWQYNAAGILQIVSTNSVLQSTDFIAAVCITAGCTQSIHAEGWLLAPAVGGLCQAVAAAPPAAFFR